MRKLLVNHCHILIPTTMPTHACFEQQQWSDRYRLQRLISSDKCPTAQRPVTMDDGLVVWRLNSGLFVARSLASSIFYIFHPRFGHHRRRFLKIPLYEETRDLAAQLQATTDVLDTLAHGMDDDVGAMLSSIEQNHEQNHNHNHRASVVTAVLLLLPVALGLTTPWTCATLLA